MIGIAIELLATTLVKLSDGFSRPGHAGLTPICFAARFYVMSLVVRSMPLGIAYLGIGLIAAGAIVLNALVSAAAG